MFKSLRLGHFSYMLIFSQEQTTWKMCVWNRNEIDYNDKVANIGFMRLRIETSAGVFERIVQNAWRFVVSCKILFAVGLT
jgi:hypothetical protein